jgi:hypothetical protein
MSPCFHNRPQGKAATLFWVRSHSYWCTVGLSKLLPDRLVPSGSSPSHDLVFDSITMRCMSPIKGLSTTCTAVPDVFIFFLSARLQVVLKNPPQGQHGGHNQEGGSHLSLLQPSDFGSSLGKVTIPVTIRREKKVVLELCLRSDSRPISHWGWEGIRLPHTRSVKSGQQTLSGKLLNLSIQVFEGSTGAPDVQPCLSCWRRERVTMVPNGCSSNLQPYMLDFKADNPITVLSGSEDGSRLEANVTFHFMCTSNHHSGTYR